MDDKNIIFNRVIQEKIGDDESCIDEKITKLDAGNTQRPNVNFGVVLALVHGEYDLRGHPIGRAYERIGRTHERGRAKVGQFDGAIVGEQYIACFDVAVNVIFRVQIVEAVERVAHYSGDFFFGERFFVHLEQVGRRAETILHDQPRVVVLNVAAFVRHTVSMTYALDEL